MKRVMLLLAVAMLLPLLGGSDVWGGGGANFPPSSPVQIVGPDVLATIVIDTHNFPPQVGTPQTTTAGQVVSMKLSLKTSGNTTKTVVVKTKVAFPPPDFALTYYSGCDVSRTFERFVYAPDVAPFHKATTLYDFMDGDSVTAAFAELFAGLILPGGLAVQPVSNEPAIVQLLSVQCKVDPNNKTTGDGSPPGVLVVEGLVNFRVPQ